MNKVSANRQKKEKILAEISDKVNRAKAMVLTDYKGMTHKQIENLKKALKPIDAEMVVTKNTLLARALSEFNLSEGKLDIQQPTATLFAYSDIVTPLKELSKSIKNLKLPLIKFGILDKKALTADEVIKLASLPSREVLLAQFVGGLKSPIYGLHRALTWNLQKFVMTLKAIEVKKTN